MNDNLIFFLMNFIYEVFVKLTVLALNSILKDEPQASILVISKLIAFQF